MHGLKKCHFGKFSEIGWIGRALFAALHFGPQIMTVNGYISCLQSNMNQNYCEKLRFVSCHSDPHSSSVNFLPPEISNYLSKCHSLSSSVRYFYSMISPFSNYDARTYSSFFINFVRMIVGHFPPLFLKICQNDQWTFSSIF